MSSAFGIAEAAEPGMNYSDRRLGIILVVVLAICGVVAHTVAARDVKRELLLKEIKSRFDASQKEFTELEEALSPLTTWIPSTRSTSSTQQAANPAATTSTAASSHLEQPQHVASTSTTAIQPDDAVSPVLEPDPDDDPEDYDKHPENHPNWWADQAWQKFQKQEAYDAVMGVEVAQRKAKYEEMMENGAVPPPPPPPPLESARSGTVVAFASEPLNWHLFIGSLRAGHFTGSVIVGVPEGSVDDDLSDFFVENNVQVHSYKRVPCEHPWVKSFVGKSIPSDCTAETPTLPVEWARYVLMHKWLTECASCTEPADSDWVLMVPDARFALFQSGYIFDSPWFSEPEVADLWFVEEWAKNPHGITNTHWYQAQTLHKCLGEALGDAVLEPYRKRPVITTAVTFGTTTGISRLVKVLLAKFNDDIEFGQECVPPTAQDQSVFNQLYHTGKFGDTAGAFKFGEGTAISVGSACTSPEGHSMSDVIQKDSLGFIQTNSGQRAPVVALYDRCHDNYFESIAHRPEHFLKAVSLATLSIMTEKELVKAASAKDQAARAFGAAEDSCDNDYLLKHGVGDQADEHDLFKRRLVEEPDLRVGLTPLPLSGPTVPQLQFVSDTPIMVYLWNDGFHVKAREVALALEGLKQHPAVQIVEDPSDAQLIVWPTVMANVESELIPTGCRNVVILDGSDGFNLHPRRDQLDTELGYFKRSMVLRKDGVFKHAGENLLPKTKITQWAISASFSMLRDYNVRRTRAIVCTLRLNGPTNPVRTKVVGWTKEFIELHGLTKQSLVTTTIGSGGPAVTWENEAYDKYFKALLSAKIIVTCNPTEWEGDFRLWESIISGALVFVDVVTFFDRMPNPLKHKKHVIIYDSRDKRKFLEMLEYYVTHEDEARTIAKAGKEFVLAHHMASNRIDFMLQEIKPKMLNTNKDSKRELPSIPTKRDIDMMK